MSHTYDLNLVPSKPHRSPLEMLATNNLKTDVASNELSGWGGIGFLFQEFSTIFSGQSQRRNLVVGTGPSPIHQAPLSPRICAPSARMPQPAPKIKNRVSFDLSCKKVRLSGITTPKTPSPIKGILR